jgi:hypothetical protein
MLLRDLNIQVANFARHCGVSHTNRYIHVGVISSRQ